MQTRLRPLRRITLPLALAAGLALASVAQDARADDVDVVLLQNGGRVQGTVVEDDPATGVQVRMADGTLARIPRASVQSVQYAHAATVAPRSAPASTSETEARAPGSHPGRGLLIGGLTTWTSAYVVGIVGSAIVSATTRGNVPLTVGVAAIPLVGPWIAFPVISATNGQVSAVGYAAIAVLGILQGVGFGMFVAGAVIGAKSDTVALRLTPTFDPNGGAGVGLSGTF